MCLLSYYPPKKQPDLDRLRNGAAVNGDGHGFAIVSGGVLIVRRGMDPARLIGEFASLRAEHPHGPALFHSRMGTSGSVGRFNCHPFFLGEDKLTVVAHNGVLWNQRTAGDRRCDTRAFAEGLLANTFSRFDHMLTRSKLEQWLGGFNKMVVLTVNPAYEQGSYILNEKRGQWNGGVWYSNSDFLERTFTGPPLYPGRNFRQRPRTAANRDNTLWGVKCGHCKRKNTISAVTGYCRQCDFCNDCGSHSTVCMCYVPAALTAPDASSQEVAT